MKNKLLKKFISFSYGSFVGLFLGVLITMISTRLLPPDAFGKASMFDLFLQVGLIFVIFGTDQSFTRFFYEEYTNKRGALLYNTLKLPLISLILIIIIVMLFYKPLTYFMFDRTSLSLALILIMGLTAQLFYRYGQLVIRMQQKGNLYSLVQIFNRIFNLGLILLFYYLIGGRFETIVYSKALTIVLLMIILIYFGKDYWKVSNVRKKDTTHSQKDIIRFGLPFVLTLFITWLFESFDKIALRQWSDFEELGMYSAAMRLVALVIVLKESFRTFWTPVSYEKFEKNPEDKDFFSNITTIVSFVMFLVAIISIMAKDLIVMLLGSDYKEAALLMPFLVFIPLFYTISETTVIGINFMKKTKWHILIAVTACIINIIGNWILVPEYGALGASISTAFAYTVFFTTRTAISQKYYKVKFPLLKIYLMTIIVSIYAFYSITNTNKLLNFGIGFIPILLLCIIFYKNLINFIFKRNQLFN